MLALKALKAHAKKRQPPKDGDWEHPLDGLDVDGHAAHMAHHQGEFMNLRRALVHTDDPAERQDLAGKLRACAKHWNGHRMRRFVPKPDSGGTATPGRKVLKALPLSLHGATDERTKNPPTRADFTYRGLPIHIETRAGQTRRGKGWAIPMKYPYGEIPGTMGMDGDPVDVVVGPYDSDDVYVVTMHDGQSVMHWPGGQCPACGNPPNFCLHDLDEQKVFLGFGSPLDAESVCQSHYDHDGLLGPVFIIEWPQFEHQLRTRRGKALLPHDDSD